ncbi:MAG TPA: extensin family protein [Kofleriaceae bacterium]|nr:extensin family protein [Kofleriaceae bacterium]
MSSSSRVALVTAVAVALVGASTAEARTRKKKKRAKKAKVTEKRRNNMPNGWAWPPSKVMGEAGKACTDELDTLGIAWKPAKRERKVNTPITLDAMELAGVKLVSVYRRGPYVMDCELALGLAHHLPALHAIGVRELHFSRIHEYTKVRVAGKQLASLSRHALGLAIDVRSFVDADGRKAVVLDDYPLGDRLLLEVEKTLGDSGGFRTILTPRNDPQSHDDHFHLEVRVDYTAKAAAIPRKPAT